MNKSRRTQISKIWDKIIELKQELEMLRDEEQEAFDNLPESFQYGEKGEKMESAINEMDQAISSMEEVEQNLEEAIA